MVVPMRLNAGERRHRRAQIDIMKKSLATYVYNQSQTKSYEMIAKWQELIDSKRSEIADFKQFGDSLVRGR